MKIHYESFDELYQDIKEHLVKEGCITLKTFDGPDYSKEDTNEYKDLYLIKHYRNPIRGSLEVYNLGDLGRLPADSKWGNIEQLRELYSDYGRAIERNPIGPGKDGGYYNNYVWYIVRARSISEAISVYQLMIYSYGGYDSYKLKED